METGESTAAINARGDANSWPRVLAALQGGATIYRPSGLKSFYTQCRDDRDPNEGLGISAAMVKRLEKDGVLVRVGVDRYGIGVVPEPVSRPLQSEPSQMQLF